MPASPIYTASPQCCSASPAPPYVPPSAAEQATPEFQAKKAQVLAAARRAQLDAAREYLVKNIEIIRHNAMNAPTPEIRASMESSMKKLQDQLRRAGFADDFPEAMAPLAPAK